MKILGIIPARFGSLRFPGKPLVNINGKTMIQRVYEQTCLAKELTKVIVATDSLYIYQNIKNIGGIALLTNSEHLNGTSRCAEAFNLLDEPYEYIINIQGDEPFINPMQIDELAIFLKLQKPEIATQVKKEFDLSLLSNSNIVKAILTNEVLANTFTRKNINNKQEYFYKHIGLYAFRSDILKKIVQLSPSKNELNESLEQLRWLDNNYKIAVQETTFQSKSIDTLEDLDGIEFKN